MAQIGSPVLPGGSLPSTLTLTGGLYTDLVQSLPNENLVLNGSPGDNAVFVNYNGGGYNGFWIYDGGTENFAGFEVNSSSLNVFTSGSLSLAMEGEVVKLFSHGTNPIFLNWTYGGSGGVLVGDGGSTNSIVLQPGAQNYISTTGSGGLSITASNQNLALNTTGVYPVVMNYNTGGNGGLQVFDGGPTNSLLFQAGALNTISTTGSGGLSITAESQNLGLNTKGVYPVVMNYNTTGNAGLQIFDGGVFNYMQLVPSSSAAAFSTTAATFTFNKEVIIGQTAGFNALQYNGYPSGTASIGSSSGSVSSINGTAFNLQSNSTNITSIDVFGNLGILLQGYKPSTNTWAISSSQTIKQNVVNHTRGLNILRNVRPVEYEYADNVFDGDNPPFPVSLRGQRNVGIIAEEIQAIAPQMVEVRPSSPGGLAFDSHEFTYMLINAVKELDTRVTALETKLGSTTSK